MNFGVKECNGVGWKTKKGGFLLSALRCEFTNISAWIKFLVKDQPLKASTFCNICCGRETWALEL